MTVPWSRPAMAAAGLACLVMLLMAGCAAFGTTPTPPATTQPGAATIASTSGTPVPPTATATLLSPTSPPTPTAPPASPMPTQQPKLELPSVADILCELEGLPIDAFFEESYRQLQLRDPDTLFINGWADDYGVANDRFTDMSDDYVRETQYLESGILALLRGYERDALSPDQQLAYAIYEWYFDDLVRGHAFTYYDYPVNPLTVWGKQNWLIGFMVSHQPIRDKGEAEACIARLAQIDAWVGQLVKGLKLREQAGVVPPAYLIEASIAQVEGHLHVRTPGSFHVDGIELYASFRQKLRQVEGINDQDRQALLDAARREVEETFIPAFRELRECLERLERVAPEQSGVHQLPEGEAYYAHALRHETTTALGAEQVHELGLAEVARLQAAIQQAAARMGYPSDIIMAELEEHLASEGEYLEGDALLTEYERLIARADHAVETWSDLLPQAGLIIQPEPFGSGIGYYRRPPYDGSGPGVFYTNPDLLIVHHIVPSSIFHETIPSHHLQGALARELDLPTFRCDLDLNGYVEGWAVYAERLAGEMGLYSGHPEANLGRLQFELARAARLVVDTGVHVKGWTRQDAATAYEEATGHPTTTSAMDRYVTLPDQGCGYTVGLLKLLELRQRAQETLGERFDITAFHNVILRHSPLPLEILKQVVDEWIETELND